jgi:hypothetical protein
VLPENQQLEGVFDNTFLEFVDVTRMMVKDEIEWLDGTITEAVRDDKSLSSRCFDIAKGDYNSAACILRCFVFGDSLIDCGQFRLCMLCSRGFIRLRSAIKVE